MGFLNMCTIIHSVSGAGLLDLKGTSAFWRQLCYRLFCGGTPFSLLTEILDLIIVPSIVFYPEKEVKHLIYQ